MRRLDKYLRCCSASGPHLLELSRKLSIGLFFLFGTGEIESRELTIVMTEGLSNVVGIISSQSREAEAGGLSSRWGRSLTTDTSEACRRDTEDTFYLTKNLVGTGRLFCWRWESCLNRDSG